MDDLAGHVRGFRRRGKAWYGSVSPNRADVLDFVTLGLYRRDGTGTAGEFRVEWFEAAGRVTARLAAGEEGWMALAQFKDVLDSMGRVGARNIDPGAFCVLLGAHGLIDTGGREWTLMTQSAHTPLRRVGNC